MATYFVGIDLGGTNAKAGVVDHDGKLLQRKEKPLTKLEPDNVVVDLVECANEALSAQGLTWGNVKAIGVGSPGGIKDGCVVAAANFPDWHMVPLRDMVSKATNGTKTVLTNDADAAVAAEVWVGAARKRGAMDMVMLTLGTGVGCGVVINGDIVQGASGLIEGGHMIVEKNGLLCGCGQRGCLEAYSSAAAVARRAQEEANAPGAKSLLTGKGPLSARSVFEAAEKGDEIALKYVNDAADNLGFAITNISRLLDTQMVVLAGGMSRAGEFLFSRIRKAHEKYAWEKLPNNVVVVAAEAGDDSGIIGAAAMGKRFAEGKIV